MTSYKPGQVSALLFASKGKLGSKNDGLAKLFSFANSSAQALRAITLPSKQTSPAINSINGPSSKPKKKKPKKLQVKSHNETSDQNLEKAPPSKQFPHTHETLQQNHADVPKPEKSLKRKLDKNKNEDDDPFAKRPRRDRIRDKDADNRTVFVGNCPLTADKKKLKKLFREFGEIETIRFRCAPSADPTLPKRAIVITKNFHEQCNNFVSYVVFKDKEAATNSLVRNGYLLDGLHLRVDMATQSKKHDKKRSIFVGNLPFTVSEEVIRGHFSDCGEITNVRIVRDRTTNLGKGICYVHFESKDSVGLALKLNNTELQGRPVRVMVCSNKVKLKADPTGKKKKASDKPGTPKAKKKIAFAPSNVTGSKFQTILKTKKEKRFRKIKKKKDSAQKQDGLSSIFGDLPVASQNVKFRKSKKDQGAKLSQKSSPNKVSSHHKGKAGRDSFKGKSKGNSFKGKSKGNSFKGKAKGSSFKGKGNASSFKGKGNGSSFKGKSNGSSFKGKSNGSSFKGKGKGSSFKGKGKK